MNGLVAAQLAEDLDDIIFLEETDSGDAGRSCFEAGRCAFERDASEREHGDVVLAGLAKSVEPGCFGVGDEAFFEDWGEEGDVGSRDCGLLNLRGLVTRLADRDAGGGARATQATLLPYLADLCDEKVACGQMYPIG